VPPEEFERRSQQAEQIIRENGVIYNAFADGSQERLSTLASSLWDKRRDQTDVSERCRQYVLDYHSPEVVSGRWLEVLGIHTRVTAAESGVA